MDKQADGRGGSNSARGNTPTPDCVCGQISVQDPKKKNLVMMIETPTQLNHIPSPGDQARVA